MTQSQELPPISTLSLASLSDQEQLGQAIFQACTTTGFFYLKDHSIPKQEVDRIFDVSSRYFLQTDEEDKRKDADFANNIGYRAMKAETLDPATSKEGDLKESFNLVLLSSKSKEHAPPSQTFPASMLPEKEEITSFIDACKSTCDVVLQGFAHALGLTENYFKDCHHGAHDRLRLIHYPPTPPREDGTSTSIRAGSHSDYGSCTLLFQKDVGGLQVEVEGKWVDIPPQEGCIVVNVGDAMEFWTKGLFQSTQHRVALPRTEAESASRFSVAYFCQPDEDTVLEPLEIAPSILEKVPESIKWKQSVGYFEERMESKGVKRGTSKLTGGSHLRARLNATH
ncbi:Clavaminate synthase-like protein [Violaceomyces palustris]|uniref:Clavaminate synthase-like protein n=1 Tax=Violaceomyces palustris TaxID=1673888 RepID=A0ACD0P1J1_9BASI|nr:Clavaminate synthase-like protein [Violaceomyces palustris]